jgi:2-polyprenyl-3-methyl-5-hydroxy-6-metoxy-1,4-benzoquinol methylase
MNLPTDWCKDFFHGVTLDLWRDCVPPEQTRGEVEFLIEELIIQPGARILDVPCGNGRHSLELARRGFQTTGIDLAEDFINEARKAAADIPDAVTDWTLGDMRDIEGEGVFDGAFCQGNSFGYLDAEGMDQFLAAVARSLKPAARFIVETGAAAESLLPKLPGREWYEVGNIIMALENRYLAEESCLETEYTFIREGITEKRHSLHWVYTAGEIRRMLQRAGFKVLSMYGSAERNSFEVGSLELIVVAEKAA